MIRSIFVGISGVSNNQKDLVFISGYIPEGTKSYKAQEETFKKIFNKIYKENKKPQS